MKQTLATISFLALAVIGIGYFFAWPAYDNYQTVQANLEKTGSELENLKQKESLVRQLDAAEPTLTQQTDLALRLIPTEEERESFVSEIDAIAQATGISLGTFSFSTSAAPSRRSAASDEEGETTSTRRTPKTATTKEKTVEFQANITGSYANIVQFIQRLERAQRLATLKVLNMANGADNTSTSVSLSGSFYFKAIPKIPNDLKFSDNAWNYLQERTSPATVNPTGGRPDPFATY